MSFNKLYSSFLSIKNKAYLFYNNLYCDNIEYNKDILLNIHKSQLDSIFNNILYLINNNFKFQNKELIISNIESLHILSHNIHNNTFNLNNLHINNENFSFIHIFDNIFKVRKFNNIKINHIEHNLNFNIITTNPCSNNNKINKFTNKSYDLFDDYPKIIKKSNTKPRSSYLSEPDPAKGKYHYTILRFTDKEDLKSLIKNNISTEDCILDYEIHESIITLNKKEYYMLIEHTHSLFTIPYIKYFVGFRENSKFAYQRFINQKGPLIEEDNL